MYDIDFNIKGQLQLHVRKFLLYPEFWISEENLVGIVLDWQQKKFTNENVADIPEEKGLYCFVVKPEVPNFFETKYLFYIGQTKRTLRIRYGEYLSDQRGVGKPRNKIYEMLNLYRNNIYFYYAKIANADIIEENEEKLLNTFMPAINTKIPKARILPELKNIYE
ncbi:MAG: hypothetical protein HN778_02645 [Prolixibacteraceae bacterium]|jgi:hypothetical protein|nr:hypothetical protein [Prolixibacteraceae bacterium]MBT6004178.1 hypothetical protein [Prolixibacteraceae bacterium]MBT6763696.1 hypothetical protein [Prolixibacteraceae bacterium]MBT7001003.1 hypothetical protein [Prolixibacteraceae bacterium]MBT7393709.1 hypothetical protein [Prolixibacteraceae bacterium]